MREFLAITLIVGLAMQTPARAGQPISESLVDCATLFTISNRAFPERRNSGKGLALDRAGERLLDAARTQARAEGWARPHSYVDSLTEAKARKWDAKGMGFVFTQEFRDWVAYCRSLSEHLDIALLD